MPRYSQGSVREANERLIEHKPINVSDEQRHKDRIDGFKLYFELLKHVATVSTGSVVIIATLIDRMFKSPSFKFLIALSFTGFFIAIGMAAFGMAGYAAKVRYSNPRNDESIKNMGMTSTVCCIVGFAIGISSLIAFALINLYS